MNTRQRLGGVAAVTGILAVVVFALSASADAANRKHSYITGSNAADNFNSGWLVGGFFAVLCVVAVLAAYLFPPTKS